jgi:hypothetical protein
MLSAVTNLVVYQGADFETTFFVTKDNGSSFDLTDYSGASKIKKHYESSTSVDINVTINQPETSGAVTLELHNSVTSAMTPGKYVYDVLLTSPQGIKSRVLEGVLTVVEGVTI